VAAAAIWCLATVGPPDFYLFLFNSVICLAAVGKLDTSVQDPRYVEEDEHGQTEAARMGSR
jgi:hypothetical protein